MSRRLRLSASRDRGGRGRGGDPCDRFRHPRHHDERLDLGRPARLAARKDLSQAVSARVKFKLAQGGSDVGVADVAAGRVSIATPRATSRGRIRAVSSSTRSPRTRSASSPTRTTSWPTCRRTRSRRSSPARCATGSDVPGATATGSINLVVRTAASVPRTPSRRSSWVQDGVQRGLGQGLQRLVQQTVQSDASAIGYVSQDFVTGTNPVAYQGVGCNLRTAKSGEYGGVRNFWMVTRGHPRAASALQRFIFWVQNSAGRRRSWQPTGCP